MGIKVRLSGNEKLDYSNFVSFSDDSRQHPLGANQVQDGLQLFSAPPGFPAKPILVVRQREDVERDIQE